MQTLFAQNGPVCLWFRTEVQVPVSAKKPEVRGILNKCCHLATANIALMEYGKGPCVDGITYRGLTDGTYDSLTVYIQDP